MAEETFVIVRDYAPSNMGSALWAGFTHVYRSGDFALHLETIFENTPATKAGLIPSVHAGSIFIAINETACFDPNEEDLVSQAKQASHMFDDLTKGASVKDPFTLTIRKPTQDEVKKALKPLLDLILDKALETELPQGGNILRSDSAIEMLLRVAGIEKHEIMKMQVFFDEITRRGWEGNLGLQIALEVSGSPENIRALEKRIAEEFPGAEVESFRESMSTKESALLPPMRVELDKLLSQAYPDILVTGDEDPCVVCLHNVRKVALVHNKTAHLCVCNACAMKCQYWSSCPICRLPVDCTRRIEDLAIHPSVRVWGQKTSPEI